MPNKKVFGSGAHTKWHPGNWDANGNGVTPQAAPASPGGPEQGQEHHVLTPLEQMKSDMEGIAPLMSGVVSSHDFETQGIEGLPKKPKKKAWQEKSAGWNSEKPHLEVVMVGADVEVFLRNKEGKPIPVCGLIGGTKEHPMPIISEGYALQEDNVALEYNIPASKDKFEFLYSIMRMKEEIIKRTGDLGLVPAIEASMRFDPSQLQSEQARLFGCEPDFNVWEQCVNEKPSNSREVDTLRTAGGHIHVSVTIDGKAPKDPENRAILEALVMAMDIFVGVPMVWLDKDLERRKLYGRAGAFRPKQYGDQAGIEYRVLSPFWTRTPQLAGFTYENVLQAIHNVNAFPTPRATFLGYKDLVYQAINEGNTDAAMNLKHEFGIHMPPAGLLT